MGTVTATRYHDFCAGHRVHGQGGKCENLHGHNYRVHFDIRASEGFENTDDVGRVLDFSVIKSILCEWLEENWDHKMIIWEKDPMFAYIYDIDKTVVKVPFNPTAENMAGFLVEMVAPYLFKEAKIDCTLISCTIDETRKCSATYSKD
ncbi:MAG: 6-carboxytetrahydropterin synthase [Desulfocapsa sp.]|nr:6-carboxytetrahydropterin synthase [Desulfocapsa sp.]